MLRLMFICCHPALTPEAQTTLTLKLVAGLSTREIARAYLAPRRRSPSASRARSAHSPRPAPRSRSRAAPSGPSASRPCSASSTCSSTRATRRPRATTGCARALRRGRAPRPHPHGARARRPRGPRPRRPHGAAVVAARARVGPTASRSCSTPRTRAVGCRAHPPRPRRARPRRRARPARRRGRPVRAAGGDRRGARARHPSTRPTGTGSPSSTSSSGAARARPSPSSTAAVALDGRRTRPGSRCSTSSTTFRRCAATTSCRACAATSERLGRVAEAAAEFERAAAMTANARERQLLQRRADFRAGEHAAGLTGPWMRLAASSCARTLADRFRNTG